MENENCRQCRKFSEKLFLKGERCLSPKCTLTRRSNAPGAAALKGSQSARRIKKSEYGLQLQEKQKAKSEYGLRERQFRTYYEKAAETKGATGEIILKQLELRLDNVVYRLGWGKSRSEARQLVNHGHAKVNGKVVDIPSYQLKAKDIIEPVDETIKSRVNEKQNPPTWIKLDKKNFKAEVIKLPQRAEIDTPVDEQLIVEYYSR